MPLRRSQCGNQERNVVGEHNNPLAWNQSKIYPLHGWSSLHQPMSDFAWRKFRIRLQCYGRWNIFLAFAHWQVENNYNYKISSGKNSIVILRLTASRKIVHGAPAVEYDLFQPGCSLGSTLKSCNMLTSTRTAIIRGRKRLHALVHIIFFVIYYV